MANNIKPLDDWLRVSSIYVDSPDLQQVVLPNVPGLIILTPSAYKVKTQEFMKIFINEVHTPWLHSSYDLDSETLPGQVIFRHELSEAGIQAPMLIYNPKRTLYKYDNIDAVHGYKIVTQDELIPVTYQGQELVEDDGTYTQFSLVCPDHVEIVQNSLVDFSINVKEELAEDTYIQIPYSTPFSYQGTIHAKIGDESTLPIGAVAGIIGMKTEGKVDASLGTFVITDPEDLAIFRKSTFTLFKMKTSWWTYGGYNHVVPDWYTDALGLVQIQASEEYKTFTKYIGKPYYVCGMSATNSTFGTGLFVKDRNKVAILPWHLATQGITQSKKYFNKLDKDTNSYIKNEEARWIFDASGWVDSYKTQLRHNLIELPVGSWFPVCGTALQIDTKYPMVQRNITNTQFIYSWPFSSYTAPQMTPLFAAGVQKSVVFAPAATYDGATRAHLMPITTVKAVIDLQCYVAPATNYLGIYSTTDSDNAVPQAIKDSPGLYLGEPGNPAQDFYVNQIGWHSYTYERHDGHKMGTPEYYWYNYQHTYSVDLRWVNPEPIPTVGQSCGKNTYTTVPVVCAEGMAFTAFLPAGTPKGAYRFKPFKEYITIPMQMDYLELDFTPQSIIAAPVLESTKVPYLGANLVTTQINKMNWQSDVLDDSDMTPAQKIARTMLGLGYSMTELPSLVSIYMKIVLDMKEVPLVGYPLAQQPMLVDIMDDGVELCNVPDLMQTAPFEWLWYKEQLETPDDSAWVVAISAPEYGKIYIVAVDVNEEGICVSYNEIIKILKYVEAPFGEVTRMLGITHTRDIRYHDGKETDILAIYCMYKQAAQDTNSSLAIVLLRDDFNWDTSAETITKLMVLNPDGQARPISLNERWPSGIAVMYPYIYTLGYIYTHVKSSTPLYDIPNVKPLTGEGWQMCLTRTDILSGTSFSQPIVSSAETYRFTFGLPARDTEFRELRNLDARSIGTYMRYDWGVDTSKANQTPPGPDRKWERPTSPDIPMMSARHFPSIAGLCGISGQLLAVSNGTGQPVLISPISCCVEELGLSIFPFTLPFNGNITASKEHVYVNYLFQGRAMSSCHPFMHICMADGLAPIDYSQGIDIQDVSFGTKVVRKVKVHNSLLRDIITSLELNVPEPEELPYSEVLHLSLDSTGPWDKKLLFDAPIEPGCDLVFYVKVEPVAEVKEPITLYLNAKFNRTTSLFGFRT